MTFANAPWALDGARTPSSLARRASFIDTGGVEGVTNNGDLKVTQLDIPGNGIKIAGGGVTIINRYQTDPNEAYTAVNLGDHVLAPTDMPPASSSAKSHLVCTTIGDPEFSRVGHPWLGAGQPASGEEADFDYVRPWIITNVPSSTKRFSDLGLSYPAYAMARLDIPANTTTITNAMLVDLRELARPKTKDLILTAADAASGDNLAGTANTFMAWPASMSWQVAIPLWANQLNIFAMLNSVGLIKTGTGNIRVTLIGAGSTVNTVVNETGPGSGIDRVGYGVGGVIPIPDAMQGTTATLRFEATRTGSTPTGFLSGDPNTTAMLQARFEEVA